MIPFLHLYQSAAVAARRPDVVIFKRRELRAVRHINRTGFAVERQRDYPMKGIPPLQRRRIKRLCQQLAIGVGHCKLSILPKEKELARLKATESAAVEREIQIILRGRQRLGRVAVRGYFHD